MLGWDRGEVAIEEGFLAFARTDLACCFDPPLPHTGNQPAHAKVELVAKLGRSMLRPYRRAAWVGGLNWPGKKSQSGANKPIWMPRYISTKYLGI
jgi:hypothetical protein